MRKIIYPEDIRKFKMAYLKDVFGSDLPKIQSKWNSLRNSNNILQANFPKSISKLLIADYSILVKYYITYIRFFDSLEALKESLVDIFKYSKYQPKIAEFFMRMAGELNITTCYYCESAFINVYEADNVEKECLAKLNSYTFDKLKKRLNTSSDANTHAIITGRPYLTVKDFNDKWHSLPRTKKHIDKFKSIFNLNPQRNHFDIDHALDKGSCPVIALSVMNFVPCCQVCNEKLKRSLVLGDYLLNKPKRHLSPSSPSYDFENQVRLRFEPSNPADEIPSTLDPAYALDNPDKYVLRFECIDSSYESIVEIFRLRERYEFHKREGLYWLQMKAKYNDSCIQLIADSLSDPWFTAAKIHEDIFREDYDDKRHPCFKKFKRDILKGPK